MPFLAKSITKIRTIEKTTILSPGVDWISIFKESIFIFNSSKNLSHSLPPITNIAPIIAPVVEPSPPKTIIIKSWKVSKKSNWVGDTVVNRQAKSPPPTPSKNAEVLKAKVFIQKYLFP